MSKGSVIAMNVIKDIKDFLAGKKEPVMPAKVNWQGWESGCKVEYFNENEISTKCQGPAENLCGNCGFHYLSSTGEKLTRDKEPLCGIW